MERVRVPKGRVKFRSEIRQIHQPMPDFSTSHHLEDWAVMTHEIREIDAPILGLGGSRHLKD